MRYDNKECVLDNPIPEISMKTATPKDVATNAKHVDVATKVACIMIAIMSPELQKYYEDYWPYQMNLSLGEMLHKKSRQECYEVIKALKLCKLRKENLCVLM